ncbi:MAG TPA: Gfo/Idh/MocA family oxidoreductase [Gaiellaceae bacterium]|nr:Gfo/Idh/MocA family oxidoreductase [Gaiellaceae bacterium]
MRFGFVGLGRAARLFHLPALKTMSGVEVVGGYDASEDQRRGFGEQTALPVFASVDELFERGRPDVVVVATPPDSHADLCVTALERGTHVIVEKPFVTTAAEGDRVLAAADSSGKLVAVNHQYREKPIFTALRDSIRGGRYGRLAFAQFWQLMNQAPWEEKTQWRAEMARRTLLEGGVHLVDLIIVLYGELPVAVTAQRSAGVHDDPDADPVQLVTLEFSGNRLGQITIDRLCRGGTRYFEVRADCERASLRASLGGRALVQLGIKRAERPGARIDFGLGGLAWAEIGQRRKVLARSAKDQDVVATRALFERVVDSFRVGVEPPSSAREARDVIAVIEAAYESSASGRRVELAGRVRPEQAA